MLSGLGRWQDRLDSDVWFFGANYLSGQTVPSWGVWHKPTGCNFIVIIAVGPGGNGGNGVVGAAGSASGGAGGGGGACVRALFPAYRLPDELFIQVGAGGSGQATRVSLTPELTHSVNVMMLANAGATSTGGTAGSTLQQPMLAQLAIMSQQFTGMAGLAAGTTGVGTNTTYPLGSQPIGGGAGGGGVPASGVGSAGGGLTNAGGVVFVGITGAAGGSTTTTPGQDGMNSYKPLNSLEYYTGGLGGGSSHATATGVGLFGGNGGNGNMGTGGGGGGGCLTGGTAGLGGKGGDGYVQIAAF